MTQKVATTLKYVMATQAAEKMIPSHKAVRLCKKIADGRISGDYAVEQIKHSYGLKEEMTRS